MDGKTRTEVALSMSLDGTKALLAEEQGGL
jgi:hypothetical protein